MHTNLAANAVSATPSVSYITALELSIVTDLVTTHVPVQTSRQLQYDRLPVVRILSHQQLLTASVMHRLLHRQQEQTQLSSHIQR